MSDYYQINAGKTGYIPLWKSRIEPGYNNRMQNKRLTIFELDLSYIYHTTAIIDHTSISKYLIPNLVEDYNAESIANYHLPQIGYFSHDLWNLKYFNPMPCNFWISDIDNIKWVHLRYSVKSDTIRLIDIGDDMDNYYDIIKFIEDNPQYNINGTYSYMSGLHEIALLYPINTISEKFEIVNNPKTPDIHRLYGGKYPIIEESKIYDEPEGEQYQLPIIATHSIII
jgi:hypothetical protein